MSKQEREALLPALDTFKEALLRDLRTEMMALHLGDDQIISEEEAARLLGVSTKTLYRMRVAGDVHCGYLAGKPRYSLGQVRRMMRAMISQ